MSVIRNKKFGYDVRVDNFQKQVKMKKKRYRLNEDILVNEETLHDENSQVIFSHSINGDNYYSFCDSLICIHEKHVEEIPELLSDNVEFGQEIFNEYTCSTYFYAGKTPGGKRLVYFKERGFTEMYDEYRFNELFTKKKE